MKKLLLLVLCAALLTSLCVFPAFAEEEPELELYEDEWWDDYHANWPSENIQIKFFDANGTQHNCDAICGNGDDVVDELTAFTWFQGAHLVNASGHFAHVGAYVEITIPNCVQFKWYTQYRGPVEHGYSTSATIYVDGEEVAAIGTDKLNGNNDTAHFEIWASDVYDGKTTKVFKIVNTQPKPEDSEKTDEEWIHTGERLPFDLFKISYYGEPFFEDTLPPEYIPPADDTTGAPTEAPDDSTAAPADDETDAPTEAPAKSGCGSIIAPAAIVLAAALAAPVVMKKRK